MKELVHTAEPIPLPHPACGAICRNAMNEVCIEFCAPAGEMEMLEVRKGITPDQLPRGKQEDLKWKARVRLNEVVNEVLINHLLGKGDIYIRP